MERDGRSSLLESATACRIEPACEPEYVPLIVDTLNYHHLLYFWVVVKEGTLARAGERLQLSQSTISIQLKKLEESLGVTLFRKSGRHLELTESGQLTFRYADQMFNTATELVNVLRTGQAASEARLRVGLAADLPACSVWGWLRSVTHLVQRYEMQCEEGILADLSPSWQMGRLDLLISESVSGESAVVSDTRRPLGSCGSVLLGMSDLLAVYQPHFPRSLEGAPLLVPAQDSPSRKAIDAWLETLHVRPAIVAATSNTNLLLEAAAAGQGLVIVPAVAEADAYRRYGLRTGGTIEALRHTYFADVQPHRRDDAAVQAVLETLQGVFATP